MARGGPAGSSTTFGSTGVYGARSVDFSTSSAAALNAMASISGANPTQLMQQISIMSLNYNTLKMKAENMVGDDGAPEGWGSGKEYLDVVTVIGKSNNNFSFAGYLPNTAEMGLSSIYPYEASQVFSNRTTAINTRFMFFSRDEFSGEGDIADAFRHTLWNALNVRSIGKKLAVTFSTAHEISGFTSNEPYQVASLAMDLTNNKIGMEFGSTFKGSTSSMVLAIYYMAVQGKLVMIGNNNNLVKSSR